MTGMRGRSPWISRVAIGIALCAGSLSISTELRAQENDEPDPFGERLYIGKGCLGCHGASGRGGVGPSLAGTSLAMDAFLHQLRAPRDIMPVFPE
ncbi:MAG: c-type cytochrome [Gemmatimonadota bacterium]